MKLTFTAQSDVTFICSLADTTHSLISKYLLKSFFFLFTCQDWYIGESTCFFFFLDAERLALSLYISPLFILLSGGIDGKRERSFFWELYSRKTWTFLLPFTHMKYFGFHDFTSIYFSDRKVRTAFSKSSLLWGLWI